MTDAGAPPTSRRSDSIPPGRFRSRRRARRRRPYRVLARKYRPASFADLIGQDAVVRTVSNAFETGRIPQAWILTGVRGVGKTTTARILARALNYELPDGSVRTPTIHMPVLGVHCQAIMESRHMDVLEMDAASHTGVDDVRQINDSVRYAPASARYKVYIIDEVHMLSTAAFNAFLKTLEEPPEHAKFVFATTEIRKVPVTVLSRCQRFDLRRVEADILMKHLAAIAAKEDVEVEAGSARHHRPGGGRLGPRFAVAARSGDRARGRYRARRNGAADARPCRPHPGDRPVRVAGAWRHREGIRRVPRSVRHRCRSGRRAVAILPSSSISSPASSSCRRQRTMSPSARPNGCADVTLRRNCRCGCCHGCGRCCSRASRKSRPRPGRRRPPKWSWCASPMLPTCRHRTRRSGCSIQTPRVAGDCSRRAARPALPPGGTPPAQSAPLRAASRSGHEASARPQQVEMVSPEPQSEPALRITGFQPIGGARR